MLIYKDQLLENLDTRNWERSDTRFVFAGLHDDPLVSLGLKERTNVLTPDSSIDALRTIYDYYTNSGTVSHGIVYDAFGYNSPINVEQNRRLLRAVAEVEGIQSRNERWKILQAFLSADDEKMEKYVLMAGVLKGEELKAFDWETTINYGKVTHEAEVWKQNLVDMEVEKAVFDITKNHLTVKGDTSITAGMADGARSQASSRTNGAKGIGIMSIGSLESKATSTDNVSAIIEGTNLHFSKALNISAAAETEADSVGFKSGSGGVLEVDHSDVKARVGAPNDKQTVSVVIGKDVQLNGEGKDSYLTIIAANHGYGVASMDQSDTSWNAGAFKFSTQTTESWLDTLITFGENTSAKANTIKIVSQDTADGKSAVDSSSVGILMNFNTMKGKNTFSQENNIDFGKSARIEGMGGDVVIAAFQNTKAFAETKNNGGGLISAGEVRANNTVDRVTRINMAEKSSIDANLGSLTLKAVSGAGDDIVTNALTEGIGLASVNVARATAEINSDVEIIIGSGVSLESSIQTRLDANATSHQNWSSQEVPPWIRDILEKIIPNFKASSNNSPGISTSGKTDAAGLVAVPNGVAHNTLNFNTYIGINEGSNGERSSINSTRSGRVIIWANNRGLNAKADSIAKGKGGFGVSNSTSTNEANLQNTIWIDRADISPKGDSVNLRANNGASNDQVHLIANSHAGLSGLGGKVAPTSRITGNLVNQIRTNDSSQVNMSSRATHTASSASDTLSFVVHAGYDRWEVDLWFFVLTLTKADVVERTSISSRNRCDFCNTGVAVDVNPTKQNTTIQERYKEAFERSIKAIIQARAKSSKFKADARANQAYFLAKGLVPLTYLDTLVSGRKVNFKARYDEEEQKYAELIYATDVKSVLQHDVMIKNNQIKRYMIWKNIQTQHDVYLLPNATRLVRDAGLDYVSEVLTNGNNQPIDVFTALDAYVIKNPVIPIGLKGSLDFASGKLALPAQTDFDIYMQEVSGEWLLDSIRSGFFRWMDASVQDTNDYILNAVYAWLMNVPTGTIMENLVPDDGYESWKLYWFERTPYEVQDRDETLIALIYNEETDEIQAIRTSLAMLETGKGGVDVSMYMFRDSKSDRMGEEKYNIRFFDTPAGEEPLVMLITDVLDDRVLEMPRTLKVHLRAFQIDGADLPAYSLSNHLFVMCDGTDGLVSLFDGFYTNTFDGDIFDSAYVRIDGIKNNNLNVTIKKDQPIWPEKTNENHATDLNGDHYELVDNVWQNSMAAGEHHTL